MVGDGNFYVQATNSEAASMCGIVGVLGSAEDPAVIEQMTAALVHRGPDEHGCWTEGGAALGMRRLSVIDIDGGHQPMQTMNGRHVIVYNGEVYNFRELRTELKAEGVDFRTDGDTEVVLQGIASHGPAFIERLRGMFAFAVHDRAEGITLIARDRLGVKPLYVARTGGRLLFASEIKALLEHPAVCAEPDLTAVSDYLALRYVPGPGTLFQGIEKFPTASWMLRHSDGSLRVQRYWEPPTGSADLDEAEALERFTELFDEATRIRMIADRPVGAFLSGGVDSNAIVASLSSQFDTPVSTFSVGFDWEGDELTAAAESAKLMGCEHHEVTVGAEDCALLPTVCWHLDEPVGDGITLPMFLVSRLARRHVTVVQSGEGADELLGGYFMHRALRMIETYDRLVPDLVSSGIVAPIIGMMPAGVLDWAFDYPGSLGRRGKRKLLGFLSALPTMTRPERYHALTTLFDEDDRDDLVLPSMREAVCRRRQGWAKETGGDLNSLLAFQFEHWLPDDILMKQDKMTMANSLEGRVPFMDHHLVEFLVPLAARHKIHGRRNKAILRNYLERLLGPAVARRPKKAFYIPIDQYLRQEPLKGMVEELLGEKSVRRRGLFRWEAVRALRSGGEADGFMAGKQVFSLAMLEMWFRIFIDREAGWS